MMRKPLLGVTMGDPAGIGPEVILKAIQNKEIKKKVQIIVLGSRRVFESALKRQKIEIPLNIINNIITSAYKPNHLNMLEIDTLKGIIKLGKWSKITGQASYDAVKSAIQLALDKKVDAIVTAPICKQAWGEIGVPYTGHTEVLAKTTKTKDYSMMFVNGPFRIVLATIHHPLQKAVKMIKKELVIRTGITAEETLKKYFGIRNPRIAIAGINPHAGEKGMLGQEEEKEIKPAMQELNQRRKGRYLGPFPSDTLFVSALQGQYDLIMCMYHDQGLIPFKLLALHTGVNVTAGIPIIRTSPDHGTAFDLAGKGKADPGSMIAAILTASQMVVASGKVKS
ncbi:4-hydroxythreonine-4-phosphate dehydrogenase PdxA [bacterium]|nr:4-hydroxythreonine-4-phosphate dehydrogenase PdxA [bacterium]